MPIDDREQQFERALARHLRDGSGACPDAETLAAYHERTLALEEMAKWKEHIAGCERCQETLALVEQTDGVDHPEWKDETVVEVHQSAMLGRMASLKAASMEELALPTAVARSVGPGGRPRANWKWIAPLGAIAAGVIVWIGAVEVRNHRRETESVQIAQSRRAEEPTGTPGPAPAKPEAPEEKRADVGRVEPDEKEALSVAPKTSPRVAPPAMVAEARGQLDKKKDATSGGIGHGNGRAAAEAAPSAPPVDLVEQGKNEVARDALVTGGQAGVPMAAAKPAPAPAASADRMRSAAAAKSMAGYAGSNLSAITGTVLDPSGAAVSGAVITAIDASKGTSKSTVADASGNFQLTDLPSDQYRVIVAQNGFANSEQTLTLQPRQNQQLQVQLKLGTTSQTVEVSAATATLNTEASEVATGSKSIRNLPTTARSVSPLVQLAAANALYIVAPDKKVGWRVGDAGKIERTTDYGKTWKEQTSGVSTDLRTGSATSGKVCWVVGKAGTILLTTDGGKHWKQISSPISGDVGGIHAGDALRASIWDLPNRNSYETADGGVTWRRTANE